MITHFFHLCWSADPSTGRVDTSMLSDQALLELLAQGFDEKSQERFQEDGEFIEFIKWGIVEESSEGEDFYLNVTPEEDFFGDITAMRGVFETKFIPPTVSVLFIRDSKFDGTFDFGRLPQVMQTLSISCTPFEGSIDVEALPSELRFLVIHQTQHSGSIDFTALPKHLEHRSVSGCAFGGSVNLTALPAALYVFDVSHNDFSGSVDLCHLPADLIELDLSGNAFDGSVCFDALPPRMKVLDLGDNRLTGELSDEILRNLPETMKRIGIHNNDFSGKINLQKCRQTLDVCVHRMLPEHRMVGAMQNTQLEVRMREVDEYNDY